MHIYRFCLPIHLLLLDPWRTLLLEVAEDILVLLLAFICENEIPVALQIRVQYTYLSDAITIGSKAALFRPAR